MRDDLLVRADRAIRESQLLREWAHHDRLNARVAVSQARATVRLARAEGERSLSVSIERLQVRLSPDLDSFWAHSGGGGQPNPHDFRVLCAEGGQFERNCLDTWIGKMELYLCVVCAYLRIHVFARIAAEAR